MLPVVAIVGRPNVGKSTLFNRLTRSKNAITSSFPGTTRDRQYGMVNLEDRHFILVDTGGIGEEQDEVGKLITHQAFQAMEEADHLLFLIDGQVGITEADKELAHQLRKMSKPLQLVVNKCDSGNPDVLKSEAFELGLGTPIPIAATHGLGITALIEQLFPEPHKESKSPQTGLKLAIVGRANVGKSTLANRILGEDRLIVHDSPGTTRDSIFIPFERFGQSYTLIDTAGVRRRKKVTDLPEKFSIVKTLQAIENSDVVLYIVDARIGVSDQDLKVLGFILDCGKALVIAVNKWDDLSDSAKDYARATLDRHLDFIQFARIHFISALHGTGVGNLFDSVNEAYAAANKKLPTPLLTKLLQQAIETHSPPLVHGRRIKLRYAHSGGHNPQKIIIHGNQLDDLPESYRRYLASFYQKKLKLYGSPVHIIFKGGENPYDKKR